MRRQGAAAGGGVKKSNNRMCRRKGLFSVCLTSYRPAAEPGKIFFRQLLRACRAEAPDKARQSGWLSAFPLAFAGHRPKRRVRRPQHPFRHLVCLALLRVIGRADNEPGLHGSRGLEGFLLLCQGLALDKG